MVWYVVISLVACVTSPPPLPSGGSRPSDKGWRDGHPDPEIRGGGWSSRPRDKGWRDGHPDPEIRGGRSSRPRDKGWRGGHPDPEIRGGGAVAKKIFRPFGPQFGLKIGGGPGPSPGSATATIVLNNRHYMMDLSFAAINIGTFFFFPTRQPSPFELSDFQYNCCRFTTFASLENMVFNPYDETPTWRARTEIALNLSPISIDLSRKASAVLAMNPPALLWALGVTKNKNGDPMGHKCGYELLNATGAILFINFW